MSYELKNLLTTDSGTSKVMFVYCSDELLESELELELIS